METAPTVSCAVCDLPATGNHFGTQCCRACAAFYRRSRQLNLKYKCRHDEDCDVTNKNRYSCRFCRFKKCEAVGMRTNAKVAGSPASSNSEAFSEMRSVSPPTSTTPVEFMENDLTVRYEESAEEQNISKQQAQNIAAILKPKIDCVFTEPRQSSYPLGIPLSLCQQALVAYSIHNENWPNCVEGKLKFLNVMDMEPFVKDQHKEIVYLASFCMSIQPFAELPFDQKWLVFKHFWPRFCEMDRTFVTCKLLGEDLEDERFVAYDGSVFTFSCHVSRLEDHSDLDEERLKELLMGTQKVFHKIFTVPFKLFQPDQFELMYMILSMMWNIKNIEDMAPETLEVAKNVQNRLSEDLYNYYAFELKRTNYADRIYKLSHLVTAIDRVNELQNEDSHMARTFNIFKHDIYLDSLRI